MVGPVPMDVPTRASLLLRLQDPSDQAAWSEFHERYRGLILSYCRRRKLQASDAEDICQIVLSGLARSLPEFRYESRRGRFRSYLGSAVRNAIQRQFGGARGAALAAVQPLELLGRGGIETLPAVDADEADAEWEREWMLHHYRRAMETLRAVAAPRDVAIFQELLGGKSVEGIAAASGMSAAAVQKVKERVRDRLKRIVAGQTEHEDDDV
jgi:RNA polymerase sigma factor (sigma-70 family)